MNPVSPNIFPVLDREKIRKSKELFLKQNALAIWITGLSGAGKTTIAIGIEEELIKRGFLTQIFDGDNVRNGINKFLGFSEADRVENIRRIAEVSKLFLDCGIITINSFISPTNDIRKLAREIIGEKDFIEIFVNAPLNICETRDVKGLYKKARKGEIKEFTGIDSPFEPPQNSFLEIKTDEMTIEQSVRLAVDRIIPLIEFKG